MDLMKEVTVDSRQVSPKDGLMLQMLDLISLARLAGCESGKVWVKGSK